MEAWRCFRCFTLFLWLWAQKPFYIATIQETWRQTKKAGAVTLAIILGHQLSYALYCLLLLAPYVICAVLSVNLSVRFLVPLTTLGMAFKLEKSFREGKLMLLPRQTAKLNLMFGLLYIVSCTVAPLSLHIKWFDSAVSSSFGVFFQVIYNKQHGDSWSAELQKEW